MKNCLRAALGDFGFDADKRNQGTRHEKFVDAEGIDIFDWAKEDVAALTTGGSPHTFPYSSSIGSADQVVSIHKFGYVK